MSTTLTMTTIAKPKAPPPPTLQLSSAPLPSIHSCPSCGYHLPPATPTTPLLEGKEEGEDASRSLLEAQARIADLETQVRLLNQKAAAAVDRWADYEDELTQLRKQAGIPEPPENQAPTQQQQAAPAPSPSPTRTSFLATTGMANRISALLSPRKSTPNLRPETPSALGDNTNNGASIAPAGPTAAGIASKSTPNLLAPDDTSAGPPPPSPTAMGGHPLNAHADLLSALHHEQSLRRDAETRLNSTSKEVEELSVSLFEQANEMVATERRARAKLEERVELLEQRDVEKRRRLEKLEGAMGRIERVRAIIGEERVKKMREEAREAEATKKRNLEEGGEKLEGQSARGDPAAVTA